MNDRSQTQREQQAVDAAVSSLTDLLHLMAAAERNKPEPERWDEEYAGAAINDCLDRLFCAPEAGMPKPSEGLTAAYHSAYDRARPFLEEGFPLPGSFEEDVDRRARALFHERWPELGDWDQPTGRDDPIHLAIVAEATRDAQRAVDIETAPPS